ncbi:MAG: adenylate/guanylate cyclase domain-containing protein [Rhodospirillales bacterium]|nr:MAG: adenylate/guanylate cyclase domain-containing protein [Rhodospirillales bacterium]
MAREQRRLAAIVSTDVVGYSRLMGRDESGTLAALKALRAEVVDPAIAAHGGRIVKTTGDGLLLEFASVVDALRCVLETQTAMAARASDMPADRRVALRVGVNIGDIIIDGDDIFGDGVNVAARLQEIAPEGGVCISGRVHDDIRDRLDAAFEDGGEQTLKNIARPVRVWRWAPGAVASPPAGAPAVDAPLALPDKPSIAVLPFQNMSGDPEQEYFADGMVEDITTALSRIRWLFVVARNSSFTYKGAAVDVKRVGRELGVRYVLEGSIRRAANRVRITGQLIDVATGAHLWADRFEGGTEDIFDLQDRVTSSIVGVLTPSLERAEIERARRKPTGSMDAYDCYLRAVASARLWTVAGLDESIALCMRAIELDPNFAAAYGQAARGYTLRKANGWLAAGDVPETDRLARLAWAVDRDDAVAIGAAGYGLAYVVGDVDTGAAYVERALSINPNYAPNWGFSGWINNWLGRHEVAIEHAARAMLLSPRDPSIEMMHINTAHAHFFLGRYDEASARAGAALSLRPDAHPALRIGAASAAMAGRHAEAAALMARLRSAYPTLRLSTLGDILASYSDPAKVAAYRDALRLAGLPE